MKLYVISYLSKHGEEFSEFIYSTNEQQAIEQFKRRYKLKPIEIYQLKGN